ncbi:MAG: hypothetical protein AABX47_07425 [Nanoarchaeota archaeon]
MVVDSCQMSRSGIPVIDWNHIEQDQENIWISQIGEGNQRDGTVRFAIAVHYFKNPDGQISLPSVMINLEACPSANVFGHEICQSDFYFFHPEAGGRFVGAEGHRVRLPFGFGQNYQGNETRVKLGGRMDCTSLIRGQLTRIHDSSVVQSIDGFFRDEHGLLEEEVKNLYDGEKSLVHRYYRDSAFYGSLSQKETAESKKEYSYFSMHHELAKQLVHQLDRFR